MNVHFVRLRMDIDVSNIPTAIRFVRADSSFENIPQGFPVLILLDQSKLPYEEKYLHITDWREVIDCIKKLIVRGAPAIGIAGAAAVALRAAEYAYSKQHDERSDTLQFDRVRIIDDTPFDRNLYRDSLNYSGSMIKNARPTAVNLAWAVDGALILMASELDNRKSAEEIADVLYDYVCTLIEQDIDSCQRIGEFGARLLPDRCTILTHCNAGALATAGIGTALGVVYTAAAVGKLTQVFSDETRPVNQGARLSVWELSKAGVPVTLICDDMAASVMAQGKIDAVIVGADRIAANGDTANKIGTLGVAILATYFRVPFYVAAPVSTIDINAQTGADIPIEERDSSEVLPRHIDGVRVYNPAFDVTPAHLITAIITEQGVFSPGDIETIFE